MFSSTSRKHSHIMQHISDRLHRKNSYSLRKALSVYSTLMAVIMLSFAVLITAYTGHLQRNAAFDSIQQTMNLYNDQLKTNLDSVDSTLLQHVLNNTDLVMLAYNTDPSDLSLNKIHSSTLLSTILPGMTWVDGLFVYTRTTDAFICQANNTYDPVPSYIKKIVRQDDVSTFPKNSWCLKLIDGQYYLVRLLSVTDYYIGSWVSVDTMLNTFSSLNTDAVYLLVNSEGKPVDQSTWPDITFDPEDAQSEDVIIRYNGVRYLQVAENLTFCDLYLMALIPLSSVNSVLAPVARTLFAMLVLLILLLIAELILTGSLFQRPVEALQKASDKVASGDFTVKLPVNSMPCLEVREIDQSINSLIDQVLQLQQTVYEEQLAKKDYELQYLRTQVAPHFLINCFTTINSIPNTEEGATLRQRMVETLSDHLRYTLGSQKNVPLDDELYYVENYIELSQIRFPGCLTYEIECDGDAGNGSVFPLILLTFTENAIKYNLVMGEPLTIKVYCEVVRQENGPMLHLVHIDSGSGYDPEFMEFANSIHDLESNPFTDGTHIGMYNGVKRTYLIYGDRSRMHFSNEPGMGARVDIWIPYLPLSEEEEE